MAESKLYYIKLTDKERELAEQWSHQWYQRTGHELKIPPALYEDLESAGVRMRYFEKDPANEFRGVVDEMRQMMYPDLQNLRRPK